MDASGQQAETGEVDRMPEKLRGLFLIDSVQHVLCTANSSDKEILISYLTAADQEELLQLSVACNAALVQARPATPAAKPKAGAMRSSSSASADPAVKLSRSQRRR